MIPTTKTKRIFIGFLVLNILMLAIYIFVSIKIENEKSEVSILVRELKLKLEKEERLKSSREIIRNISDSQKELNACFVEKDGVVIFIEYVESVANISGVDLTINSVSIDNNKPLGSNAFFEELELNFETEGLWKDEFYFLSLLESSPYYINIEKMILSNFSRPEESNELWTATFSIKAIKKAS